MSLQPAPQKTPVNIKVVVRARPLCEQEQRKSCKQIRINPSTSIVEARTKPYSFDAVFPPDTTQEELFLRAAQPIIDDFLKGYNCSIFAYGQTNSGKTYSISGSDEQPGIIPRAIDYIFNYLNSNQVDFQLRCSFVEVYNEEIYDLIEMGDSLQLFEERQPTNTQNRSNRLIIQNLTETLVNSPKEIEKLLCKANGNRKTAETAMNERSSRSHSIFTIQLMQKQIEVNANTDQEIEFIKLGKLNLVDLAGSENIQKSGTAGAQFQETSKINKSLLTLGRVINCLTEHKPHIPYRESKLTRILQDSLGGATKTAIIATISLSDMQLEETISTLDYMTRAKRIQNAPEIMQKINSKTILKEQTAELKRLRDLLEMQKNQQGGVFIDEEHYQEYQDFMNNRNDQIKELEAQIQAQIQQIAQVSSLLSLQRQKYDTVKKNLNNAVGYLNQQHDGLETFRDKVASGRQIERKNQEDLESFKIEFQTQIDNQFQQNAIKAVQDEQRYTSACTDFISTSQQVTSVIQQQIGAFAAQNAQFCDQTQAQIDSLLQSVCEKQIAGIVMNMQQQLLKPMNELNIEKMGQIVVNFLQQKLQYIQQNVDKQFLLNKQQLQKTAADCIDQVTIFSNKTGELLQQQNIIQQSLLQEAQKQLQSLKTENNNLKEQLKQKVNQHNSEFKVQLTRAIEALVDRSNEALQQDIVESTEKMLSNDGVFGQTTVNAIVTANAQQQKVIALLSELQSSNLKNVSLFCNSVQAEAVKVLKNSEDLQKQVLGLKQFVGDTLKSEIQQPVQALQKQQLDSLAGISSQIQSVGSEVCSQVSGQVQEYLQSLTKSVKTIQQKIISASSSYPQITNIQNAVASTLRKLRDNINNCALAQLQTLQFQSVLPKNRTPTIKTPPFRGIGLEASGVIGVQTPTVARSQANLRDDE